MRRVFELVIPGDAVGKGRAQSTVVTDRRTGAPVKGENGRFVVAQYTPAKTRDYEDRIGWHAKNAMRGRPPFAGPLRYDVQIRCTVPESWSRRDRAAALAGELWPAKKPDATNILKAVEDGMNGIVWHDDAQVVAGSFIKLYAAVPMVIVRVDSLLPVEQPSLLAEID